MEGVNRTSSSDPGPRTARQRRLTGALTLTMLASCLLMLSPLPYSLFSGLTGAVALVLLVPLIVRAARERRYSLAVVGALLGVPATLMLIGAAVLSAVFYGPMVEQQECQATALTEQARSRCAAEAEDSMVQWVGDLFGG